MDYTLDQNQSNNSVGQNVYILQLETENNFLRDSLAALKITVLEVVSENQQLFQKQKSSFEQLQNHFQHKHDGLSDEEKAQETFKHSEELQKLKLSIENMFIEKIEQLQRDLAETRGQLLEKQKDLSNLQCNRIHTNQASDTKDTSSTDELKMVISKLQSDVAKMRDREYSAEQQVQRSILLVEQAQLEKLKVENTLQQAKDMAENQQRMWQIDKERIERTSREKIQELSEILSNTKDSLEKVVKERQNLELQLVKAKTEAETYYSEMQNLTIGYKQAITSASVEKSKALQDMTRVKVSTDSVIKDYQMEITRLQEVNQQIQLKYNKSKDDSIDSQHEIKSMQKQIDKLGKELTDANNKLTDNTLNTESVVNSILSGVQKREDEVLTIVQDLECKRVDVFRESVAIMQSQRDLMMQMKSELGNAMHVIDDLLHLQSVSANKCALEKQVLEAKMESLLKTYYKLQVTCDHKEERYVDAHKRLTKLDQIAQQSAQQIAKLLMENDILLKHRSILNKEVEFLPKNFQ